MDKKTVIRPGNLEDLDRVGELWHQLYKHEQSKGMMLQLNDDASTIWVEQMKSRLSQRTNMLIVAEMNGEIIGFLAGQAKILGSLFKGGLSAIIQDLYVDEQCRGDGLGRLLVEDAMAKFLSFGIHSVEVQVAYRNTESMLFWTAVGWHPEIIQVRRIFKKED